MPLDLVAVLAGSQVATRARSEADESSHLYRHRVKQRLRHLRRRLSPTQFDFEPDRKTRLL